MKEKSIRRGPSPALGLLLLPSLYQFTPLNFILDTLPRLVASVVAVPTIGASLVPIAGSAAGLAGSLAVAMTAVAGVPAAGLAALTAAVPAVPSGISALLLGGM